ncbi:MAG: protein kinase domain-containing protein [bacterium]
MVRWIRQACHGIARAHDLRLLHNDIKPGNLFLNVKGECMVADFGFASQVPIGSPITTANGCTPQTVAPEIAAAPQSATASVLSDVYSLGATAYWLLAVHPSHDFTNVPDPLAQLALVASQAPERLRNVAPHVPAFVANAIEKAMSRNPHDRYESVTSFAEALGRRPGVERRWRRTNEHSGHHGCWRGTPASGSEYVLCLEPTPKPKEHLVVTRHAGSGNRVSGGQRTAAARSWGQAVRTVMDRLT